MHRVRYREIIADKSQQSWLGLGLCFSFGFSRANNLHCWRASQRRSKTGIPVTKSVVIRSLFLVKKSY